MTRRVLVALVAVASMLLAVSGSGASRDGPRRIVIERTFRFRPGSARAGFAFTIHAQVPDSVVLVVPRGARVSALAMSADRSMGIGGSTHPVSAPCAPKGGLEVCIQSQEWCPLVPGRWRATVTKASSPAAVVRVRFVFVTGLVPG